MEPRRPASCSRRTRPPLPLIRPSASTLSTYKFSSKSVAVPIELLQDSAVDVEGFVRKRLVTRLGRITNTHFTTGTGLASPTGIVTAAGSGKVGTTGQTLTVIYDDLIDLQHSVDPAYRQLGNCGWMMNDASVKVIRKIKDTTEPSDLRPWVRG
jgi:HK97 family phage major capsid protein